MNAKYLLTLAVVCLALALAVEAGPVAQKKGRVLPGALAVKKLVLLKFKKIIPVSLILLKSGNENEAELVPVYPSNEIPANVEFIPTPNGISGDKEVQAIAIPTELHEQLAAHGMVDLEHLQAMLSQAEEEKDETVAPAVGAEELLNIKEDDETQLLPGATIAEKKPAAMIPSSVRRIAVEDTKPSVRTAVEDLPLFLYSVKDDQQTEKRQFRRKFTGRRHHA